MNIIRLFEKTEDEVKKCGLFKKVDIATDIQPSDITRTTTPSLYYMPYKKQGTPTQYTNGVEQRIDHMVRFLIICKMDQLDACQKVVAEVFAGYEYVDGDRLSDLNQPYNKMQYMEGNLVHIQSNIIVWDEIYSTYKIGVC